MKTMSKLDTEESEPPSIDIVIDHQLGTYHDYLPSTTEVTQWIQKTVDDSLPQAAVAVVYVDPKTIQQYNLTYRQQAKPTNILSFPAELPEAVDEPLLGDLIVCPDIVNQEAKTQQIANWAHWAHIIIHGTLHLLGYDHLTDEDALKMETEEIRLLKQFGVANPYE